MKITEVKTIALAHNGPTIMSSCYVLGNWRSVLVEIHTDEGLVGLGEAECYGNTEVVASIVHNDLRPQLIGQDPLDIERLWWQMYRRALAQGRKGYVVCAISGVDIALWDLLGKACGQPVYRLLGAFADRVPVYASGGFYADGKDTDALVAEMTGYVSEGFRAVKMKIGRDAPGIFPQADRCRTGIDADLERVAAVRQAVGPDVRIMVDANCIWDASMATKVGRKLEGLGVYFFEEPVPPDDVDGSAQVAAALDMPVAGYETDYTRFGFRELIERRAVDIVQADVIRAGGFTECRRIAALAGGHYLTYAPHVFGTGVSLAASIHLQASLPNGNLLEFPQVVNALRSELLAEPIAIDADGYAQVPPGPGLGIELDPDALRRFRI